MAEIPLSQGLVALVDDEDADLVLSAGKWCVSRGGSGDAYAARNVLRSDGTRRLLKLHHFLTGWSYVDHRNGNGLDNRRGNLRCATHAENMQNVGIRVDNRSGYKGVCFDKRCGRWMAYINANRRRRYLGYFPSAELAAHAYDEAARDLHGEFARPNFPESAHV